MQEGVEEFELPDGLQMLEGGFEANFNPTEEGTLLFLSISAFQEIHEMA